MTSWTLVGIVVIAVAAFVFLSGFFRTWNRFRGTRVITCPENLQPAAVKVNAVRAAQWSALSGDTPLRLSACSRWPEKEGCGQECLAQVEASPEACLVRTIVTRWYDGKSCAFCHQAIGEVVWHERPPALRAPDGTTKEWNEVREEDLPNVFATHAPTCWACHIRESFRHDHPELVIERPHLSEPPSSLNATTSVY